MQVSGKSDNCLLILKTNFITGVGKGIVDFGGHLCFCNGYIVNFGGHLCFCNRVYS